MATNLIVVLAASGLVATGAPQAGQTRSAAAMPRTNAALVSVNKSAQPGASCLVTAGYKLSKKAGMKKCAEAKAGLFGGAAGGGMTTSGLIVQTVVLTGSMAGGVALGNEINSGPTVSSR